MAETQNYSNHTRFDPKFHFFLLPLLLLCFIASIFHVWKEQTPANILLVPITFGLLFAVTTARMYAMKVQDRVIRLEETQRCERLGVPTEGLDIAHFIALRFASDQELPALAARAKAENLTGKQIKQTIVSWRADDYRV